MNENPNAQDIERILQAPKSKDHVDLRDRAAYMHLTGSYPSHLRKPATRALRLISEPDSQPARAVDLTGGRRVLEHIAREMRLDDHPMTRKVQEYVEGGYRIRLSKGPNVRKPYRQILMYRGDEYRSVQIDGSVKDSWD